MLNKIKYLHDFLINNNHLEEASLLTKHASSYRKIKDILKYPEDLAQIISKRFGKHDFLIAKWLKEYNTRNNKYEEADDWLDRLGKQGNWLKGTKGSVLTALDGLRASKSGLEKFKEYLEEKGYSTDNLLSNEDLLEWQTFFENEIIKEIENDIMFYNSLGADILSGRAENLSHLKNLDYNSALRKYDQRKTFDEKTPIKSYPNNYKWIDVGKKSSLIRDDLNNCGSVTVMSSDPDSTMLGLFDENKKAVVVVTWSPNEKRISGIEGEGYSGANEKYYEYILDLAKVLDAKLDASSRVENKKLSILYLLRNVASDIQTVFKDTYATILSFVDLNNNKFYTNGYKVQDQKLTDNVIREIESLSEEEKRGLFIMNKSTNDLIGWTFSQGFENNWNGTQIPSETLYDFLRARTREAILKERNNFYKYSGAFSGQCNIYNIQEESFGLDVDEDGELDQEDYFSPGGNSDEYLEEEGFDYYDLLEQVEFIFSSTGVRISSEDKMFEACIDSNGKVYGASVIYYYMNEKHPTLRFSVAVDSANQGSGIGRKLVESIISQHKGRFIFEAWVINPNMAKLLESMGFEGDWTPDNPMMYLY